MTDIVKGKILKASRELFLKTGFRDVTIDDICRKVGISKKTFYSYYSHKEDLINELVLETFRKGSDEVRGFLQRKNPVEVLVYMTEMADNYKYKGPLLPNLARDLRKYYPDTFRQVTLEHKIAIREVMEVFVKKGMALGCFRDEIDLPASLLLFSLFSDAVMAYNNGDATMPGKRVSAKALSKAFVDIIVRTLLSKKGWEEYLGMIDDKTNNR